MSEQEAKDQQAEETTEEREEEPDVEGHLRRPAAAASPETRYAKYQNEGRAS